MSNKAMTWAIDCGVRGSHKLVLILLADCHNGSTGACFPAQQWIAEKGGIAKSTIQAVLNDLEEWGFITRETKALGRGKGSKTQFELHLDIFEPQIIGPQNTGVRPTESSDLDPQNSGSPYKDKPESEPEGTGSLGATCLMEKMWRAAPDMSRKRSSRKLVLAACKAQLKAGIPAEQIDSGWVAYLASPEAMKEGGKFVPALDRWIKDQKFEAWAEAAPDPDLFDGSGPSAAEWPAELETSFQIFSESGSWIGSRYGHHARPDSPEATYPAGLYEKFKIEKGVTA